MKFSQAIELYIADMCGEGRINSPNTERGYRDALTVHAVDVGDRDPRSTFRDDVKRTLERWPNPNTRRKNRSILVSFYDWAMQELEPPRDSNAARQTRPPKSRKPQIYRMTRDEVVAFLQAAATRREQRVAYLGVCAGIRNHELRHLQRRHFERPGWVHVSADIAKGGRERWVPILPELEAIVAEILASVEATTYDPSTRTWIGEYVIPAERWRDPGRNTERMDLKLKPASRQVLRTVVMELGRRAGIHAHPDAALDAPCVRRSRRPPRRDQQRPGAARARRRRHDPDVHRCADARRTPEGDRALPIRGGTNTRST
jgi:site-specific recombinase XerD